MSTCFIEEVSSGLLILHQHKSAPDPCEIRPRIFFVQTVTTISRWGEYLIGHDHEVVLVAGIATHVCVLATALDAVSNDFSAVIPVPDSL